LGFDKFGVLSGKMKMRKITAKVFTPMTIAQFSPKLPTHSYRSVSSPRESISNFSVIDVAAVSCQASFALGK
jgi:hypothetical protein